MKQWIPLDCNIRGNAMVDEVAKEGATRKQEDKSVTFSEVKTIIKAKQKDLWTLNHPHFNQSDSLSPAHSPRTSHLVQT
ncbi:ribonuclease H1 [Elysia marginata]|uniref:Ribonuclease H1 n=1 Tax=Elysia marginata TaxID=1093978 RepID=A0AAV4HL74_9GAST|nr:ribonuclease H1 [Elysia marginata]